MRGRPIANQDQALRILHLTDSHLFADPEGALRGTVTFDSLRRVIEHYTDSGWLADIACVTGDLIQDDSAAAYVNFCDLFDTVQLPVYCLPGNHDVRDLMRPALRQRGINYCESHIASHWQVLSVDSCLHDDAGGRVSESELVRLREQLESGAARYTLVALHHPPVAMRSRWLDTVGLQNAQEFLELLGAFDTVRGVIFGHVHQLVDEYVGKIRIIGTPSTCAQFLPRSDEFAIDDRPPAYRRLTLTTDGDIESELIWI